jgi:alkylhydroperoxidase family enzyme
MPPRLCPLRPEEVSGPGRAILETFQRERGNVPNMFRTLAHHPALLETAFAHFRAVMAPGKVPALVKELIAVRVSASNACDY